MLKFPVLLVVIVSGLVQAQTVRTPVHSRVPELPATEILDTTVRFIPSVQQIEQIKALNNRFKPRREELLKAFRKKGRQGKDSLDKVNSDIRALQAEYDSAYRAILTPEQRAKFDKGKATARFKSDSINALRRNFSTKFTQPGRTR